MHQHVGNVENSSRQVGLPPGSLIPAEVRGNEPVTIRVIRYNQKDFEEKDAAAIEDCLRPLDRESITWINVDGLQDVDVVEKIGTHFDIHPLVLEDMLNTEQRPKTDDYDDYVFTVLKSLRYDENEDVFTAAQVSLVLGPHYVLSFCQEEIHNFIPVLERLKKTRSPLRQAGPDYLAYALMDAIVDNYFILFDQIGEKIEDLEEELVLEPTSETLQGIHKLKRTLISLRKSVWPLREVIVNLEKIDSSMITRSTQLYLRDVYDHTVQVLETIEGYRDMVSGMLDIYLSSVSNRLNEVMKVLTIIATIFIPITFVTGVFGMNFKNMWVLDLPFAFPATLVFMGGVVVFLLIYFREKNWI